MILNRFPGLWVHDTVVLESMFLVNTVPRVTHVTMRDAVFLVKRFIVPHLAKGVKEVHIVYDMPACNLTPKAFEQDIETLNIQCHLIMNIFLSVT